jgi:hypothetical protein
MKGFLFLASLALIALPGWQEAAAAGPGCDTSRTAVAHYSDGTLASQSGAPVPCAVKTGYGGAESRVSVAPTGEVLEVPAIVPLGPLGHPLPGGNLPPGAVPTPESVFSNNSGIGWTSNRGASWSLITPRGNLYIEGDHDLYIDRQTGRAYYSCLSGPLPDPASGFNTLYVPRACLLSSKALPGGSWSAQWSYTELAGYLTENPRFASGPAPLGQPQPVPGENMGYWCGNLVNLPGLNQRTCHRTFDGGTTWQFASFIHSNPAHAHAVCSGASSETMDYPYGGPDGTLWAQLSCDSNHYLVKSVDLASSWQVVAPVPSSGEIQVDSDNNLYLHANRRLWVSQNGGQTWSGPLDMTAPATRGGVFSQVAYAVGYQPGHVAVTYKVQRPDGNYDGYISLTHDALDTNPVFYSAAFNPPYRALWTTASGSGPPDDYIHIDVGPDGTPWAAHWSTCYRNPQGNFVDSYCHAVGGERTFQGAPWLNDAKVMTMGSLQW